MFKKVVAALVLFASPIVYGKEKISQWVQEPDKTISNIVKEEKGEIVSSDATPWWGDLAMIVYLKTNSDLYRCVDFTGKSVQVKESKCFRLIN